MARLNVLSATEVAEGLWAGNISVEDYVGSVYEAIERLERTINAFITIRREEEVVREVRERVELARRTGRRAPLLGVLVAVKDNISTRGIRTTCASRILEHYIPPYDATVVERLKKAGAVVIGKTNMDEFAMGSTGENSAFGATRNPWDTSRVPGGSSSGSAAALAAGMATLALGSDTGGSVRLPASWTGIYGLKPTYGTVSRYGLISYADSLEQVGPMARNTRDLKLLFDAIKGLDPRDATSIEPEDNGSSSTETNREGGLRVGVVEEFLDMEYVDGVVKGAVKRAARLLERSGVRVEYVRLGGTVAEYSLPAYYVIAMAEASSNLARYDCIRYGCREPVRPGESWNEYYVRVRSARLGREVKRRIMLGSWILSAGYREQYYARALRLRRLVRDSLLGLLGERDAILMPSAVSLPPRIGEVLEEPGKMYALDIATVIANLAGVPALALPVVFAGHIPLGVQLLGKPLGEEKLFTLSHIMEEESRLRNLVAPL